MKIEREKLRNLLYSRTGLHFNIRIQSEKKFSLMPANGAGLYTFSIEVTVGWKRIEIAFKADPLAGELLENMGQVEEGCRSIFCSILNDCTNRGAKIDLKVNGSSFDFSSSEYWKLRWSRLDITLKEDGLTIDTETGEPKAGEVSTWIVRFIASIMALLPIEESSSESQVLDIVGFSEGTTKQHVSNYYERDPRNRAAAIAIHGVSCAACNVDFGNRYGPVAEGYIHIHHVVPVSKMNESYQVNPATDLIPLCPNCHAVAHQVDPPMGITEIQKLLEASNDR